MSAPIYLKKKFASRAVPIAVLPPPVVVADALMAVPNWTPFVSSRFAADVAGIGIVQRRIRRADRHRPCATL
jgi:hypothetical protein